MKVPRTAEMGGASFIPTFVKDDFVGVSNSVEHLQKLIYVVYAYCCKWRLKTNASVVVCRVSNVVGKKP